MYLEAVVDVDEQLAEHGLVAIKDESEQGPIGSRFDYPARGHAWGHRTGPDAPKSNPS